MLQESPCVLNSGDAGICCPRFVDQNAGTALLFIGIANLIPNLEESPIPSQIRKHSLVIHSKLMIA